MRGGFVQAASCYLDSLNQDNFPVVYLSPFHDSLVIVLHTMLSLITGVTPYFPLIHDIISIEQVLSPIHYLFLCVLYHRIEESLVKCMKNSLETILEITV